MNRKDNNTASLAVLVFVMAGLALMLMVQSNVAAVGAEKAGAKPVVLINVDEEVGGHIQQAKKLVEQKDYAGAIDILQTLLDRPEQCFVPTEDPSRFVSLATRINETIGRLPPEGMELYRRLYDPKAERLFRTAAERLDEPALRDIISRYLHTSYGNKALNLLGGILFDRGEFSQAARCWRKTLSSFDSKDEPVLLAKIAIAYHYAGESARAAEMMKLLTKKHSQTRATIGGREQNVAAFAQRILAKPPPVARPRRRQDWPCLAGAPDSVAVMGACRPVLSPRWSTIGGKDAITLREGRVVLRVRSGGRTTREIVVAAAIHPIVVGTTVLYRSADGVAAHDLLTGEKLWPTIRFPLFDRKSFSSARRFYGSPPSMTVEDRGLWTVTAGDGKVFTLGMLLQWQRPRYHCPRMPRPGDSSVLAAFSTANQGRLCWQVGNGEGDSDLIRGGRFLTAPTYAAGRLYALVEYIQAHNLVCLNAENGRLVWETMVAQTPMPTSQYGRRQNLWQDRAGPPAVSDGKVFIVTNAGVVAAFDADTGRAIWAYQYVTAPRLSAPPNPIVVTKGRVICLPADCEQLLALRADTGKLEWSIDRRGQRDLTAVNSSRLLLSGKGLRIIDAADGKNVWTGKKITGIHGRPAVTTDAILASGKAEIIRVSLKDFSVTRLPVKQPDAILGNLICADGKLIAANAAGISVYFPPPK